MWQTKLISFFVVGTALVLSASHCLGSYLPSSSLSISPADYLKPALEILFFLVEAPFDTGCDASKASDPDVVCVQPQGPSSYTKFTHKQCHKNQQVEVICGQ